MSRGPVFKIPETVKEDTEKFAKLVEDFNLGKIDPERFKGYRVPMGIYGQRGLDNSQERYMVRVRIPGGVITQKQLKTLNEIGKKYGEGFLHITTRQDIQIHQVRIEDVPEILFKLLEVGLSPRGGGGNTVRNIMNSPRAGVNPDEVFDTTPYALALSEYLIKTRSSFNLPRKYKIAFSSTPEDDTLATVNDLGFIARKKGDKRGFKVYAGGGMGNSPRVGLVIEDFIAEDKIFHVAEAIKRFFDAYGDRSNKHQARLRFVREQLGDQEFRQKYREYLEKVLEEGIDTEEINFYRPEREEITGPGVNIEPGLLTAGYIYEEKAAGYYSLELRPENGDFTYKEIRGLLNLLNDKISLRTTNKQGLLLRGIKAGDLAKMITEISKINENLLVRSKATRPIACKGASTCRLGLCLSPALAREIRKELLALDPGLQSLLPQIYISGCPNSCGQHHIGGIGFEGKAKRYKGRLVPHYSLLLGGKIGDNESRFAQRVTDLPARRIPQFLARLARFLAEDKDFVQGSFNEYLAEKGLERIGKLAEEYTEIPDYREEPEFYKDWGKEEDFSLAGRGPGECGMGVLDIVKLDIETAKDNYQKGQDESLYEAIINVARALLIVRGIDTEKDRVIIREFKERFIAEKLVDKRFEKLLDAAIDYKLGDEEDLSRHKEDIAQLIKRVEKLFNSLNAKLEFNLEELDEGKEHEQAEADKKEALEKEGLQSTGKKGEGKIGEIKVKDLRGVKCPLNFVKAKLFIEPLPRGEIVELYLDEGDPVANVPRSLEAEGHEILSKEKSTAGYYTLKVKKG